MPRTIVALAVAAGVALAAAPAHAGIDPAAGAPYNIDVFFGPVFGSTRIIGLGGAYTAIAEGAEGILYNPAAVANRYRYSLRWFDYDVGFDYYFFLLGDKTDFDNNRLTRYENFRQFMFFLAPALHFGPFSVSVAWIRQSFSRPMTPLLAATNLSLDLVHASIGYRFFEGAFVVGIGGRFESLSSRNATLADLGGTTRPELGVLWRPASLPVRVGLAFRSKATACPPDYRTTEGCRPTATAGLQTVVMPWELEVGVALSFGPRVFNRPWKNPRVRRAARIAEVNAARATRREELHALLNTTPPADRARVARDWEAKDKLIRDDEDRLVEAWGEHIKDHDDARLRAEDRIHTVVSADLLVSGAVDDALGIEAAVTNAALDASGTPIDPTRDTKIAWSPRLGVESEVWYDRLKLRSGAYLEPARYALTKPRLHGTVGAELRLLYFTPPILLPRTGIRAGVTGDFAAHYINLSVSIGIWH